LYESKQRHAGAEIKEAHRDKLLDIVRHPIVTQADEGISNGQL
jgi:hypothetical protein